MTTEENDCGQKSSRVAEVALIGSVTSVATFVQSKMLPALESSRILHCVQLIKVSSVKLKLFIYLQILK